MSPDLLHRAVERGDLPQVRELLNPGASREEVPGVNAYDSAGYTPLMHAAQSPAADAETVRFLLECGADPNQECRPPAHGQRSVLSLAVGEGDPAKVAWLLQHGSDVRYQRPEGYDALIDAANGQNPHLLELLRLLVANGAPLNGCSSDRETAGRRLSHDGRFDAVRLLLDAGADAAALQWTPLLRAVALGSAEDVRAEIARGGALEDRDWWERTAYLLAIQTGDLAKVRLLREGGADPEARGRGGKPALFYAIESGHLPALHSLLETGADVEGRDKFGDTPLMQAAKSDNLPAVELLLLAGAAVEAEDDGETRQTALSHAEAGDVARRLLAAGANPRQLTFPARRALAGLPPTPDEHLLDVSPAEFRAGRTPRYGAANPERIATPFCEAMVRAGIDGFHAAMRFKGEVEESDAPVWCARRFGQSITFLPDGRVIQVAGEHEDHYDPDFCIYNDVFVHQPDGSFQIFGYPREVFPPTDFHTATLLGPFLYLIGSLGYAGYRGFGTTPVYRLDTRSYRMEAVPTVGDTPGWIYEHAAGAVSDQEILVRGGKVATEVDGKEQPVENTAEFVLHTGRGLWAVKGGVVPK